MAGELSKQALAAGWGTAFQGAKGWEGQCERFIEVAYGTSGQFPSALAAGNALLGKSPNRDLSKAQVGDLVYFSADDTNDNAGHVGIYVGGGKMISATYAGVRVDDISSPYWAQRFRGTVQPPDQWKGIEPSKAPPQVLAQAQRFQQQIETGAPPRTGDGSVAETPQTKIAQQHVTESKTRLSEAQARQKAAQDLIRDYEAARDVPTDKWLKDRRISQKDLDDAYDLVNQDSAAAKALNKDIQDARDELRRAENDLAKAQGEAGKAPSASAPDPKGTKKQTVENAPGGGKVAVTWVADGMGNWTIDPSTPATPVPGLEGKDPKRTQVVGTKIVDLDTGAVLAEIQKDPSTVAREGVDLATAQTNLAIAQENLRKATSPEAKRTAELAVQQAEVSLEKAKQDLARGNVGSISNKGRVVGYDTVTGEPKYELDVRSPGEKATDARDERRAGEGGYLDQVDDLNFRKAQADLLNSEYQKGLNERQAQIAKDLDSGVYGRGPDAVKKALLALGQYRDWLSANLQERQQAEAERQNAARNAQSLAQLDTSRKTQAEQMASDGNAVWTQGRVQTLADLRAPLPAAQVAQMMGMDPNSDEFKGLYAAYSHGVGTVSQEQAAGATPTTSTTPAAPVAQAAPVTQAVQPTQATAPTAPVQSTAPAGIFDAVRGAITNGAPALNLGTDPVLPTLGGQAPPGFLGGAAPALPPAFSYSELMADRKRRQLEDS